MEDLSNTGVHVSDAIAEAPAVSFAPLLTNYTLNLGTGQTNPIRLIHKDDEGYETPTSLFMIYLKLNDDEKLIARQLRFNDFSDPNGANLALEDAEAALLQEARLDAGVHLEKSNFRGMVWERPYYLTFVIDTPGWNFYWGVADLHEAIRFLARKDEPENFKTYEEENYCFFDAEPHIQLASLGDAFRVVNYFCDEYGPIEGRVLTREYCFQIYLQAPFEDPAEPGQLPYITMLIDPDGQNQGPRT